MANCALAGVWMGKPSSNFYAMVITMTQNGDAVTATITGWYIPALFNHSQVSYSLTGTSSDGSFSLQSTSGSNPMTFTGTCSDANNISGTLVGEMYPGGTSTATISCVRLDTVYPNSFTGQWQGTTGGQSASLSLMQTGASVIGVGSAGVTIQGQQISSDVSASGTVTYPLFALSLNTPNPRFSFTIVFVGKATDDKTMAGDFVLAGPITLKRVVSDGGSQHREGYGQEATPS